MLTVIKQGILQLLSNLLYSWNGNVFFLCVLSECCISIGYLVGGLEYVSCRQSDYVEFTGWRSYPERYSIRYKPFWPASVAGSSAGFPNIGGHTYVPHIHVISMPRAAYWFVFVCFALCVRACVRLYFVYLHVYVKCTCMS